MVKKNACIFISGTGSNLKNLILQSRNYNFPINIKIVISNNKNAFGLIYAKKNSIRHFLINTKNDKYIYRLTNILINEKIELICLAGYMKILPKKFLDLFRKKIINIHPSLLPKFKGLNTYKRVLKNKEKKTGCTVHFVNKNLDSGNIVCQKTFYIAPNDDEFTLKTKTQRLEQVVFPEAIIKIYRYN